MAKRTKLQELKHEFNKNILGTEGRDEQDRQQELDKARKKSVAKLEKEAQGKGDKADIAKQALAGKTQVEAMQVIDATTGEKKPITETTANTAPAKTDATNNTTAKHSSANTAPAKTDATNNTTAKHSSANTPAKKKDDDYSWAEVLEMNGGDMDKAKQWIIDHNYTIGKVTEEAIGTEEAQKLREAQSARKEAKREANESVNIEQAKDELTTGTEGEINAKVDVIQDTIDEKGNERAKKFANRVKEFTEGVDDHYIEGLPKGVWQQYKSGEYGYSKKQAQDELDKLHEGEITWSKKRRDYLLKHPELANEKERKIIDSYKQAKSTLGYFALDAIATGLNNISKSIKGDTNLDLSMSQKMNQTNLEKAIERRNEKYGTSHQNQWRSMIDSMDLSKEAKQKLQDIQIDRNFQKAFAKLDNETQKQALDLMGTWNFTPNKIAKIVAAKEMIKDDPDAVEAIISSMAGDLFGNDGKTLDKNKVAELAKTLGVSVKSLVSGLISGGVEAAKGLLPWTK